MPLDSLQYPNLSLLGFCLTLPTGNKDSFLLIMVFAFGSSSANPDKTIWPHKDPAEPNSEAIRRQGQQTAFKKKSFTSYLLFLCLTRKSIEVHDLNGNSNPLNGPSKRRNPKSWQASKVSPCQKTKVHPLRRFQMINLWAHPAPSATVCNRGGFET